MGSIQYIDGPDDIMRFMSIFGESDISLYVKERFYYDDLKNEPFFVTYIPLGFERYIRIHRDFNDSSVHPSQGRGFCGFDIRSMTSIELPVIHRADGFVCSPAYYPAVAFHTHGDDVADYMCYFAELQEEGRIRMSIINNGVIDMDDVHLKEYLGIVKGE